MGTSCQIAFTTHNPFLTIRDDVDSLIFVDKNPKLGTKVDRKSSLNRYQIIRKELGILLNDSFLIGNFNLIVEGATEKLTLHRLFQMPKYKDFEWVNIYDASGVDNVKQAINYLRSLDLKGLVILDSDEKAIKLVQDSKFKKLIEGHNWDYMLIEESTNDGKERTFEDLFPQKLYIDCFNEYCKQVEELGKFDKPYAKFDNSKEYDPPIIKALNTHYLSFFDNPKGNSITKQDIMRILLDKVDEMELEVAQKNLERVAKLIDKMGPKIRKINN